MSDFLLVLWQLPQVLLGKVIMLVCGVSYRTRYKGIDLYVTRRGGFAISLGTMCIIGNDWFNNFSVRWLSNTKAHEWGHTRQSRMLGWLYLPIVGAPSFLMNILTQLGILRQDRYYKRWPESWADRLGGVER